MIHEFVRTIGVIGLIVILLIGLLGIGNGIYELVDWVKKK